MSENDKTTGQATIGVIGLAVMGSNLARNLASREGNTVAVYNRTTAKTDALVAAHPEAGFVAAEDLDAFVASLATPRTAIIMVKAGRRHRRGHRAAGRRCSSEGDIIVDGGNADFHDTDPPRGGAARAAASTSSAPASPAARRARSRALDHARRLGRGLRDARPDPRDHRRQSSTASRACTHIGPDGAGHFVKMVHNGIEYADMQLIAEAYDLLRRVGRPRPRRDRRRSSPSGTRATSSRYLIEITAEVLRQTDAETGQPLVDVIVDQAGQKGTGALDRADRPRPGRPGHRRSPRRSSPARCPRSATQRDAAAAACRADGRAVSRDGGRRLRRRRARGALRLEDRRLRPGLRPDRAPAPTETAGTSTSARSPRSGAAAASSGRGSSTASPRPTTRDPSLVTLLTAPYFADAIARRPGRLAAGRRRRPSQPGIPAPAFSSSLAYYDGLRAERLPAALIQGQRDFFGAHTYKRTDRDGVFHTLWSGDRCEVAAD